MTTEQRNAKAEFDALFDAAQAVERCRSALLDVRNRPTRAVNKVDEAIAQLSDIASELHNLASELCWEE